MGNAFGRQREEEATSIDGGAIAPNGLYPSAAADFDASILKGLIVDRRLSPFYVGLNDVEAVSRLSATVVIGPAASPAPLTAPQSFASTPQRSTTSATLPRHRRPKNGGVGSSSRASVPAAYHVSAQELFRNAVECPICFLVYPRNINFTRCCDQPICTECFIQIKRPESTMESASCPYCVEANFAVSYIPPHFLLRSPSGTSDISMSTPQTRQVSSSTLPSDVAGLSFIQEEASILIPEKILGHRDLLQRHMSAPEPSFLLSAVSKDIASKPIGNINTPQSPTDNEEGTASELRETVKETDSVAGDRQVSERKLRKSWYKKHATIVTADDVRPDWQRRHQQLLLQRAQQQRRTLQMQLNTQQRLATQGITSHNNTREMRGMQDLSGAAAAAAAIVEAVSGVEGSSRRGNRSGVRHNAQGLAYVDAAMRHMGADLEELMIMEAIRRSIIEAEEHPTAPQIISETLSATVQSPTDQQTPPTPTAETYSEERTPHSEETTILASNNVQPGTVSRIASNNIPEVSTPQLSPNSFQSFPAASISSSLHSTSFTPAVAAPVACIHPMDGSSSSTSLAQQPLINATTESDDDSDIPLSKLLEREKLKLKRDTNEDLLVGGADTGQR